MAGVISIGQDLTPKFWTGQVSVGLTGIALIGHSLIYSKGIQLKSDKNNTGIIYIGKSSSVSSSNGFALYPGEAIFIPTEDSASIFGISNNAAQKMYWLAA